MEAESLCLVDGCDRGRYIKRLCQRHYERRRNGKPTWRTCVSCGVRIEDCPANNSWCSAECRPRCAVDGCETPSRKRGWCSRHYRRWLVNGSPLDEHQSWVMSGEGLPCVYCGSLEKRVLGLRRYCSWGCATNHRENRPKVKDCVTCGTEMDMMSPQPGRTRRTYNSRGQCHECNSKPGSLRGHIPGLVARDGTDCQLCGNAVDLELLYPDPMSPSVDHVIPRSRGGPNDFANYQLAHLRCNVLKGAKVEDRAKSP